MPVPVSGTTTHPDSRGGRKKYVVPRTISIIARVTMIFLKKAGFILEPSEIAKGARIASMMVRRAIPLLPFLDVHVVAHGGAGVKLARATDTQFRFLDHFLPL